MCGVALSIESVTLRDRIGAAFGFARLNVESPWADTSSLVTADLAAMYGWADEHQAFRITRKRAMQIATISAGRNVIAGMGGRLPMFAQKAGVNVEPQPSLLGQLERGLARATTMTWVYDDLLFHPLCWLHVTERDFYGWPMWVKRVPHDQAKLDAAGNLIGYGNVEVKPADVIRIDSPLGSGLLIDAERTIQRIITIEVAAALAEDNPVPTIELHNDGDKLDAKEKEELLDLWSAARRKRGVAYTSKGVKAIEHGQNPAQLLIEGRRALSLDAVRHLNLPAWAASTAVEGGDLTYDNRSLRNWELIDITLSPFFAAVDGRLSLPDVTPRGWNTVTDTDQLTTPDQKTRFEAYGIGKQYSFIDNDWIAAQEGWARVPKDNYTPTAPAAKEPAA